MIAPSVVDRLGRPLRDLRISVTDRCNFHCVYCRPSDSTESAEWLRRPEVLTFEEIERITRLLVDLGVRKVRLTGGEPLVRRDLPHLVALLRRIPGLADIALTTNGSLLERLAVPLRDAGLTRVTVSLDALDAATFAAITGAPEGIGPVRAGLRAARDAGLLPVKLNMVVKRGMNDGSVVAMARFARDEGFTLRLIEYMDVGPASHWRRADVVAASELLAAVDAVLPLGEPLAEGDGAVASRYPYRDGHGELGIIAAVTRPFCRGCTRLRLTADGHLCTCLFAPLGHDLGASLRRGVTDEELAAVIRAAWTGRADRQSELRAAGRAVDRGIDMVRVGG